MKIFTLLSVFALSVLVSGNAFAMPRTVTLEVQNMTCGACPITVKKSLERVSGVTEVDVDFDSKTATVQFDDPATANALTEATKNAGYPSTVR